MICNKILGKITALKNYIVQIRKTTSSKAYMASMTVCYVIPIFTNCLCNCNCFHLTYFLLLMVVSKVTFVLYIVKQWKISLVLVSVRTQHQ